MLMDENALISDIKAQEIVDQKVDNALEHNFEELDKWLEREKDEGNPNEPEVEVLTESEYEDRQSQYVTDLETDLLEALGMLEEFQGILHNHFQELRNHVPFTIWWEIIKLGRKSANFTNQWSKK